MARSRQPVPVVLTREQKIAKAVEDRWNSRFVDSPIALPTWTFEVGEQVNIGNLLNVKIISKHYDGRVLAVSYFHHKSRDNPEPTELVGAWWWFDVFPLKPVHAESKFAVRNKWRCYSNCGLSEILSNALCNEYRDNPDYQRDYVWQQSDKDSLIESCFKGREIGKFVFVRYPYPDNFTEVLDGKQRINALFEFCTSKFPYKGAFWHELSVRDRYEFEGIMIQKVTLESQHFSRVDLLEIFLDVNAGGVPQSEEHLNKVRAMLDAERKKA